MDAETFAALGVGNEVLVYVVNPEDSNGNITLSYTKAKEDMFFRTNISEAPWYIVEGNDKKRERLNCIEHLLTKIPYEDVPQEKVNLPDRRYNPEYERRILPDELYVPKVY